MRILITGTDSGLGSALKAAFMHLHPTKAFVIGTSPDPTRGKGVIDRHDDVGATLYWNARDESSLAPLAEQISEMGGPIDILINNAGINGIKPFEDLSPSFIEDLMRVNFIAPVMLTHELLRWNLLPSGAAVINIVSDAAWRPMRHSLAYNCSKAALDMATQQMARELSKPTGVAFVGVRPGPMNGTRMTDYIGNQVMTLRGWSRAEMLEYAMANSLHGKAAPECRHVASLIRDIALNPMLHTMTGTCIDLVG